MPSGAHVFKKNNLELKISKISTKIRKVVNATTPHHMNSYSTSSSTTTAVVSYFHAAPELSQVTKTFVKWTGVDEETTMSTNPNKPDMQTIRIPWTVSRLRNSFVFSCSCNGFKGSCTKGTFIHHNDSVVFSKSEEFDQLDGGYDFGDHQNNELNGISFCTHVAKVICFLCNEQDAALSRCGFAIQ